MHFCRRVFHMMHRSSQTEAFLLALSLFPVWFVGFLWACIPFYGPGTQEKLLKLIRSHPACGLLKKGSWFQEEKTGGFQGWCGKCGKSNGWSPLKSGSLGNMASGRWPTRKLPGLISPTEVWLHCGLMSQCASPTRTLHRHEGEREVSMVSRYGFKGSTPF